MSEQATQKPIRFTLGRITSAPTWPAMADEPDEITTISGGFVDGSGKSHATGGRANCAFKQGDVWYWGRR